MRLDNYLVEKNIVQSRSQAASYIKLGKVRVDGRVVTKPGFQISGARVALDAPQQYVSRAALKLESVAGQLGLDFKGKVILDVGSSTGGFSDYALRHGAKKVIAVDVGTDQMHAKLRDDPRIELHEKTDIRNLNSLSSPASMVLIDVSFISIRKILAHLPKIIGQNTEVVAMVKPQFETAKNADKNKGIVKNEAIRRAILKNFEAWARHKYIIADKADSEVSGEQGNKERFYRLRLLAN